MKIYVAGPISSKPKAYKKTFKSVDVGIERAMALFREGRLKIFSCCPNLIRELQSYSRNVAKMRIYIAGPITSRPKTYKKSFAAAEKRLKSLGFNVINPAALDDPKKPMDWIACMKRDIPLLLSCDAVYLLKDWELSRGARIEYKLAEELGLKIIRDSLLTKKPTQEENHGGY